MNCERKIYTELLGACDGRLQALAEIGWDSSEMGLEEIEDEEIQEAAIWLKERGEHSVETMLGRIISSLKEIRIDLGEIEGSYKVDSAIGPDGYTTPVLRIQVHPQKCENHIYFTLGESTELLPSISRKCFAALSESVRDRLDEADEDDESVWGYSDADVIIEINSEAEIIYRSITR